MKQKFVKFVLPVSYIGPFLKEKDIQDIRSTAQVWLQGGP